MTWPTAALRGPRRPEDRVRRRDQEGVPQAGPRVPPGPQPGRRRRRGPVQGGAGRVRHPLRPGEAQGLRHLRRARARAGSRAAGRRAGCGSRSSTSATSATCSAGCSAAARAAQARVRPCAATTSRRGSGSPSRTRSRACRCGSRRGRDRLRGVPRHGSRAGDGARHVPAVRRPRRRVRLAGALRLLAAVPALPGERRRSSRSRASAAAGAGASGRRSATR